MLARLTPDRPDSVLVIAAHPDDIEHFAGGTLAKWSQEGSTINYLLCTSGGIGSHDLEMPPEKLNIVRRQEQRESANVIGVKETEFLDYQDGNLFDTLELRRDLVRAIRQYRPTAIFTFDPAQRYVSDRYLNHPDHVATGNAAFAAIMPGCDSPFLFPELLEQGYEPYKVHDVFLFGSEANNVWIDISDAIETKIRALKCHKSQLLKSKKGELSKRIRERARLVGEPHEIPFAEAFRYLFLT
jgi:LmbE family N-acetylglucosaminyl deacetylase